MSFKYYEDPILGKGRAEVSGGTGGGGGEYVFGPEFTVSGETVNVTALPQSSVVGLEDSLSAKQDLVSGGYRMEIVSGNTISQSRLFPITNVTGASVTLVPGEAYKIQATTAAVTINTTEIPSNYFGLESHLEIFIAGTGYVHTGANVVLSQPLEPDAVNNCTVRFHDGYAIISVEDHIAGYIVTVASGTTSGSLYYGLATSSNEYISIDASLNGTTFELGDVVTSAGEKHLVGNGYSETVVSGAINCTSKTTFANLAANGVIVSSGTLTLGDVFVQNVAVSGGGLSIEKVTGDGTGVIDLGGNTIQGTGGTVAGCIVSGGTLSTGSLVMSGGATVDLELISGTSLGFANSNTVSLVSGTSANVNISSGATVDLTGNSNTTPIAPGGGVTFASGGATVLTGATAGVVDAQYSFEGAALTLTNIAAVNVDRDFPSHASGCTVNFTNANAPLIPNNGSSVLDDCELKTTATSFFAAGYGTQKGYLTISGNCVFDQKINTAAATSYAYITIIEGSTVSFVNGAAFPFDAGAGTITVGANCTVVVYGGASLINGGTATTCTKIAYDGTCS